MNDLSTPVGALALLHDAVERSPARTAVRLAQVHALFADDMGLVEAELARLSACGETPGTCAAAHLREAGGKRVRPLTVLLSASCFGAPSAVARDLAVVAELVHLATLLHDDVLDDCDVRRGEIAARRLWGNSVSVLAGDLLLTHALECAARISPPGLLLDLFATLRRLVNGEIVQLRGRTRPEMTEEVYFRIVRGKTASLFEWAARAGAVSAGADGRATAALGRFGQHVGVAFQLMDDVLDYAGDPRASGKALLADLSEGKATLPLIRALALRPELAPLLEAVRQGDEPSAQRVADAVRKSGACRSVIAQARDETHAALGALDELPPSAGRELLRTMARELTERGT